MATVRQTAAGGEGGFKSPTLMSPRSSLYGSPMPGRSNSVLQARSPTPTGREGIVAVNVAVRVRPPLDPDDPNAEIVPSRFKNGVVEAPTANTVTIASPHSTSKKRFLFDRVFEQSTSQIGVWNYVASCVSSLVQGYNVSIMAYGQSGSGKSYTMGTSHGITDSSRLGIIPRAASALFEELENPSPSPGDASPTKRVRPPSLNISPRNMLMGGGGGDVKLDAKPWTVSVSYLEIYNEQLRDLLAADNGVNASTGKSHLTIREDVKGNISVKGLQEVVVETADELLNVLERGSASRQTNSTAINSQSSRSHAIFTIHLTQKQLKPETGIITTITSKLNLVDLAGSERLKNTGTANEGRVKEGISINSGLTSLGKVISQLSSRPGAHISYRDSKLTRALQDSLGGKAITHLIACVTPEAFYSSESLNTLTYAQRARAIQLTPEIQQGETSKEDLLQLVAQLRQEVQSWKAKANETVGSPMLSTPSTPSLADYSTSSTCQPDTPLTSDLSNMDICPGSVESTRERVSRSTAFHNAVESIISDYEQTIQSLQESVALSRTSALELSDMVHEKEDLLMEAHNANQELAELVEQLQQTIQSLKTHNDHGELVSDLETQVVELKTELSSYRNDHKRHLSESQYLTSQYNNSRREIETLTKEKEELEQRIRSLELKGTVLNASRKPSSDSTTSSTSSRGIRELETPTKIQSSPSSDRDRHSRRKRRSSSFFVQASVT
jgi:hypothetical protein